MDIYIEIDININKGVKCQHWQELLNLNLKSTIVLTRKYNTHFLMPLI